jgi:hypothetical protein
MRRFPWLILLALGAGFGAGLYYAWVVSPLPSSNITPKTLRADFKDQFRLAISSAYTATGNLDRARARLALLGDASPVNELTAQAQRSLALGQPLQQAQDLANLAFDLNAGAPGARLPALSPVPSPTQASALTRTGASPSPSPSEDSIATRPGLSTPPAVVVPALSPAPSQTPIPSPSAPFRLLSREPVCNPNLTAGLLQVVVIDQKRLPMPGVEINITWGLGEEHFYTGLKPEISKGYADYLLQPDTTYSLLVARSGSPISGITAPSCAQSGGQAYLGGLRLTFQQP